MYVTACVRCLCPHVCDYGFHVSMCEYVHVSSECRCPFGFVRGWMNMRVVYKGNSAAPVVTVLSAIDIAALLSVESVSSHSSQPSV